MTYWVKFRVDARYVTKVEEDSFEAAMERARLNFSKADFRENVLRIKARFVEKRGDRAIVVLDAECIDDEYIIVEDEVGNILW